jgi:hypothetical protein
MTIAPARVGCFSVWEIRWGVPALTILLDHTKRGLGTIATKTAAPPRCPQLMRGLMRQAHTKQGTPALLR